MASISRFPKTRSPAREALAAVQNEALGIARAHTIAQDKLTRAEELRDECRAKLEQARTASIEARAAHTDMMVKAAESGEAINSAGAARVARYDEMDAEDNLEAAERAVEYLRERTEEPARAVDEVRRRNAAAAAAVIAEQVEAALAEADRALKVLSQQRLACLALKPYVRPDHPAYGRLRSVTYFNYEGIETDRAAIDDRWESAFEALRQNPDAVLPSIKVSFDDKDDVEAA